MLFILGYLSIYCSPLAFESSLTQSSPYRFFAFCGRLITLILIQLHFMLAILFNQSEGNEQNFRVSLDK